MRIAVCLLLCPATALAASAFDGTWKSRLDSMQVSGAPDAFQVVNGTYLCSSCRPVIQVPADGAPHPVSGHPYYDSVAVRVLAPNSLEIVDRKQGREVYNVTYTLSDDGTVLTGRLSDRTGLQLAVMTFTARRMAAGPAGAHACSGSWQAEHLSEANDVVRTIRYQMTPDDFSMQWNGQSYTARFDGNEYPVRGDPANTTVSVHRIDARTVDETDRRNGQVTDEIHMAAAPDGRTLTITDRDMEHGQTTTMTLERQ
jgi:hypothetical protein